MEDVLRNSDLDWTVFRPPRLTDKPLTGRYRTALGQNLRGGFLISRADCRSRYAFIAEAISDYQANGRNRVLTVVRTPVCRCRFGRSPFDLIAEAE